METDNIIGAQAFRLIVALAVVVFGSLLAFVLLPEARRAWQGRIGYRKTDQPT